MVELLPDVRDSVPAPRLRRLDVNDRAELLALCAGDPLVHCFPASRADIALDSHAGSYFLGWYEGARLASAIYVGANIAPIATTRISRLAFAERLLGASRRAASVVGRADEVVDLWSLLEPTWGVAREVRHEQALMVCTEVGPSVASAQVAVTTHEQFELVMPACIAMFTEELGVSPLANGMHAPYHARVRELIEQGRSYSLIERGEVIFKAEVGAAALGVAQLQGVWVAPDYRGQGHGVAGVAAVTRALLHAGYQAVTLYANEFNARALRVYEQVGFRKHDTFATVLR